MSRTSSAVPEDLLRFERVAADGAATCAVATAHLQRAAAALAGSRSAGIDRLDLGALGRRLYRQVDATMAIADRTGDVGHAFAAAGGAGDGAVTVGDGLIGTFLLLPDGRALTLVELRAMPYRERLEWLTRFLRSPVAPDDPNFRAVAGVLAAAHASGRGGLWDDDAFRLADAGLLEAMQLGLVVAAAGGHWLVREGDVRDRAVAAWVAYATDGGDEASRDAACAWAEEQSVRYGEAIADDAGLSFGPSLEAFVRFSHVYRAAVDRHEETALLAAITGSLDLGGLARLAADVRDVLVRRIDDLIDLPFEPLVDWLRRWPLPIDPPLPFDPLDPLGLVDLPDPLDLVAGGADRILDWVAGAPPVEVVSGALTRAVTPDAVAAWVLDPAATPPAMIASVLDDVLGVQPPMPEPPASYYVGMLVDRGYLRGLPTVLPEAPGAVPRLPGE